MSMLSFEEMINYFQLNTNFLKLKDYKTNYINPYNNNNPSDYKLVNTESDISIDILKQKTKAIKNSFQNEEELIKPKKKDSILESILYQFNTKTIPDETKFQPEIPPFLTRYYPDKKPLFDNFVINPKLDKSYNVFNICFNLWKLICCSSVPTGFVVKFWDNDRIYIIRDNSGGNMVWVQMRFEKDGSFEFLTENDENIVYLQNDDMADLKAKHNITKYIQIGELTKSAVENKIFTVEKNDYAKVKSNDLVNYVIKWGVMDKIKTKFEKGKMKKEDLVLALYSGFN